MSTKTAKPTILGIRVRVVPDDRCGDPFDYIGEYHDGRKGIDDWDICRRTGEFVHDMRAEAKRQFAEEPAHREQWQEYYAEDYPDFQDWVDDNWEDSFEIPRESRKFSFFRPYAGGEKPGTDDYRKYGMQDYRRAEDYGNGWSYVGIYAEATIEVNGREQTIRSGGCYGIESDSGEDYFAEVAADALNELAADLSALGFSRRAIKAAKPDVRELT